MSRRSSRYSRLFTLITGELSVYADGPSSLMARGKASKAKATPARQGSLGVSRHPHIKKPSQLIGRQIAVPGAELARRRGGGPQLGARAGSGLGGLIKRRARRMPSCTASKSKHTHNVSLMSVFSPHQPRQPTRRAGAASDVETNACSTYLSPGSYTQSP